MQICNQCLAKAEPSNWITESIDLVHVQGPGVRIRVHVSYDTDVLGLYEGDDTCIACGADTTTPSLKQSDPDSRGHSRES